MSAVRRVRIAAGLALAMGGGFALSNVAGAARVRSEDPQALIERARRGVQTQPFTGMVEIQWNDGTSVRRTQVAVASDGTHVTAGSVTASAEGYRDGSTAVAMPQANALALPSPAMKYALTTRSGPEVVGRPTTAVDASFNGVVRERWLIDNATGALVRREVFDKDGAIVRSVALVSLTIGAPPTTTTVPAAQPYALVPAASVRKPFAAPATVGDGYREVETYALADGTLQVFYSDGLHDLSVFQQRGDLDWESLPDNGSAITVDGIKVHEYRTASGCMWVWERNGVVFTAVSDTTPDELAVMIDDLKPAAPSRWERFRSWVRSWFSS